MKFIMVVYLCLAGACESVYEQKLYDTIEDCQMASKEVMDYAKQAFPMSSGEIWCLDEEQFIKYQEYYDQTEGS